MKKFIAAVIMMMVGISVFAETLMEYTDAGLVIIDYYFDGMIGDASLETLAAVEEGMKNSLPSQIEESSKKRGVPLKARITVIDKSAISRRHREIIRLIRRQHNFKNDTLYLFRYHTFEEPNITYLVLYVVQADKAYYSLLRSEID